MTHNALIKSTFVIASILVTLGVTHPSFAQVVINMPVPKRVPAATVAAPVPAPTTTTTTGVPAVAATPLALPPTEGDLALDRYAGARTLPRDTYEYGVPRYAGIRQYGYPYPIWWGGFGFPAFGCFGNKFVGSVGHSHCHH